MQKNVRDRREPESDGRRVIIKGGSTEVRLRHEGFSKTEHRDNHTHGWNSTLDKLEKLFNK
jgi:hypothetical protein